MYYLYNQKWCDMTTLGLARRLIDRYDFQMFDGIVVALTLEAKCNILYSEDTRLYGQFGG
jgi:predicted nucleic acid-binding protein